MKNTLRNLIFTSLFAVTSLCAQGLVIPQVADGKDESGGIWTSTVVLTNTTGSDTTASLAFYQDTTGGGTKQWTPTFAGVASTEGILLPAASTLFLQTPGNTPLTQGWGELIASSGVVAYVIYTYTSGQNASQGTAQAVTAASRILVPFDNTGSHATELAVVNPNSSQVSIQVNLKTTDGNVSTGTTLTMAGEGQMAFGMSDQFSATTKKAGLAEFYASTGTFAIIALQANTSPSGLFSFTTAPVYPQTTEAPVIATSAGGGGGGGGIPAGDVTFAGFTIGKITSAGLVIENVGGQFAAYTPSAWNGPYAATKFPPYCSVLSTTFSSGTFPFAPSLFLDAGKSLSLSGPSLPINYSTLPATNPTNIGPEYLLQLSSNTLVDGGTYTLSGTGGTQVAAFSTSATLPSNFTTNVNTISAVSRSQPLTVTWGGSGFENVIIGVNATTLSMTSTSQVVVSCAVPASLETYSIPANALSLLPAVASGATGFGAVTLSTAPAIQGSVSADSAEGTTFTPNLVGGGKIKYGAFAPSYGVVQSVTIQ